MLAYRNRARGLSADPKIGVSKPRVMALASAFTCDFDTEPALRAVATSQHSSSG